MKILLPLGLVQQCIKNISGSVVYETFCTFNQLRQICDLTVCFKTLSLCLTANLAKCNLTGKCFEITYVSYTQRYST